MQTQRKEIEKHTFDLVVAGGGMAGLCAAIAAARKGVKTAIIQDRPVFGGNSSSEIRVVPYGCSHGSAWTNETGISHELILEDRATNHEHLFDHGMTNSVYDMVLAEGVRREPHLTTFMNTSIRGVESEPVPGNPSQQRIVAIYGSQLGSEKEYAFYAPQFIDASGDGTVGALAGAEYRYGREARHEFNEPLAPIVADEATLGSTITMRARKINRPVTYTPPPWIQVYKSLEEIGYNRNLYHLKKETYGGYWWLEVNNPYHQINDNQEIRDELHRHVLGVWNYIKNHSPHKEEAANYVLDWVGMIPGKRESRRFIGDVIVTEHDCHHDRKWEDGVAYAGWWIDLHIQGGILNKQDPGERENVDDNYQHWIRIAPFTLPLRAFYSRNVENLWMTGRLLSVTHVALGPVRVQLSLGLQGQSVGAAAAYAVQHGITPRQAANPEGEHIQTIRQHLLRDDIHVLGLRNTDAADLALNAKASASSENTLDFGNPNEQQWLPLDRPRAQIVPITHEQIESASYYLNNENEQEVTLTTELHALERIWDRTPGELVKTTHIQLPARFKGWVTASFDARVVPQKPYRLVLQAAPGVSWAHGTRLPTGTVTQYLYDCPGGPEEKNKHLPGFAYEEVEIPAYKHWRQKRNMSLATQIIPQPQPFGAASVNNGNAWPEDMPNIWISDPQQSLPQAVELTFDQPTACNTVMVSFDTNLDLTTGKRTEFWRAPECVRDWRLYAHINGQWHIVYEEQDNYQRRRIARFERVNATALKLEVLATNAPQGALENSVRVYEIRVYNEPV